MDGFSEIKKDLADRNVTFVAASSDAQDKAAEMAANIGFPVGHSVDKALIGSVGGTYEDARAFAQPSEFILDPDNTIVQASYSDGPLARTEASDALKFIDFQIKRRAG